MKELCFLGVGSPREGPSSRVECPFEYQVDFHPYLRFF